MAEKLSPEAADFMWEVLQLACDHDIDDMLMWRVDMPSDDESFARPFTVCVACNDVFAWGCADAETITPDNLPQLRKALADVAAVAETWAGDEAAYLFVARIRQHRPQGACYPEDRKLWPLFDACGPERELGLGNPYAPGQYPEVRKKQLEEQKEARRKQEERLLALEDKLHLIGKMTKTVMECWPAETQASVLKSILRIAEGESVVVPVGVEARVCADIAGRQAIGMAKYGKTVEEDPSPLLEWLKHAYGESLDLPVYLKRAIEGEEAKLKGDKLE